MSALRPPSFPRLPSLARSLAPILTVAAIGAACDDSEPASAAMDTAGDTAPDALSDVDSDLGADSGPSDVANPDTAPDTAPDEDGTSAPRDFTAPGPHRVGFRESSLTYSPRDGSADRTLRVVAWYPTAATTGTEVRYQGLLPAPNVLGGAPPAALGPRPVLVFSHGNTSFAEQSFFLTEFFASHGYLVVALDHTNNTYGSPFRVEVLHWRPDDIRGVLDHLERLASLPANDPFAALAPLVSDKVAVAGHSFGGYTTLAIGGATWDVDLLLAYCKVQNLPLDGCNALATWEDLYRDGFGDARVDALIPLTPGAVPLFGLDGPADVLIPTLLMTGARDATTPNSTDGDLAWTGLASRADNLRVDFANAGHFTFSNACQLVDLGFPIGISDGCGGTFLPTSRAFPAINAYALAFAEKHLAGATDTDPLLSGELVIETDATLSFGAR